MVLIEISTGTIVIAGIIVFLFVILALVGMLLYARKKLIPQGNVSITINDDQKLEVTARGRPGRRPVRNGEKVLAAVVPSEPTWVRVVDEDLARTLGWYR